MERNGSTRGLSLRLKLAALLGCLMGVALLSTPVAEGAIGTPIMLGSSEVAGSSTASLSITTTASAPAGASIIVAGVSQGVGGGTLSGSLICSDGAGHTYANDVTQAGSFAFTTICSTHQIAAPLASGSTVTVSWPGGTAPWNQRIVAFAVTGLAAAPLDRTAHAAGVGNAPSSGPAAATTQPDELLVGAIANESASVLNKPLHPGTNGTANNCAATGTPTYGLLAFAGTASPSLFAIGCTVAATGSYNASGTFLFDLGDSIWEALLATYRSDITKPTVTIDQAAGQPDPANAGPIKFTVHFNEPVQGLNGGNLSLAGSTVGGTLAAGTAGSGADYTVSVTGMSGNGTVVASIPAGEAADLAGNTSFASTSSDNTVSFTSQDPGTSTGGSTGSTGTGLQSTENPLCQVLRKKLKQAKTKPAKKGIRGKLRKLGC